MSLMTRVRSVLIRRGRITDPMALRNLNETEFRIPGLPDGNHNGLSRDHRESRAPRLPNGPTRSISRSGLEKIGPKFQGDREFSSNRRNHRLRKRA